MAEELASTSRTGKQEYLQLSALAGAFLVGVVGTKWIESESAKRIMQATVKAAAPHIMPKQQADDLPLKLPAKLLVLQVPSHSLPVGRCSPAEIRKTGRICAPVVPPTS